MVFDASAFDPRHLVHTKTSIANRVSGPDIHANADARVFHLSGKRRDGVQAADADPGFSVYVYFGWMGAAPRETRKPQIDESPRSAVEQTASWRAYVEVFSTQSRKDAKV